MTRIAEHIKLANARKHVRELRERNPNRRYVIGGSRAQGYCVYSFPR